MKSFTSSCNELLFLKSLFQRVSIFPYRSASDGRLVASWPFPSPDVLPAGIGRLLPAAGRRLRATRTPGDRRSSSVRERSQRGWRIDQLDGQPCPRLPPCQRSHIRLPVFSVL